MRMATTVALPMGNMAVTATTVVMNDTAIFTAPQGGGADALPHKDAVHYVVEVGHKQPAQRGKNVAYQGFQVCVHVGLLQKKKWGKAL